MIAAIAVFAMVLAAGAALAGGSPGADGASAVITGDTSLVKTSGSLEYQIMFFESEEFDTLDVTFSAVLRNSAGIQSGTVYPSSGTLSNGVEASLTVTVPAIAGKYTLTVTFSEKIDGGAATTTERTQAVTVVEPVVLTAVLANNSDVDFTDFAVYFHVDGKLVEGSKTLASAVSGGKTTVTYDWVTESLSNGRHTFQVVAGEENIGDYKDVISGGGGEFFVGHSDYGLVNILMAIFLIVLAVALVYVYRKPVKNYGKPKARR
ncbi:MAG: hypothetical protein FWH47_03275 [Methanomassiliicoccaceae archaeon]|nr:hypothetical protein [Methanomassiliicoccaceae archaeon]